MKGADMSYLEDSEQRRIFSENLRKYIGRSGKTQKDIAIDLDVNPPTFSMWVKGKAMPSVSVIRKIADYFGVGITDLVDDKAGKKGAVYYLDPETAEAAQQMHDNQELKVLFDAARTASPEDLRTTYQMLMALKRKEQGSDD
jgi:transcriptional regulator with XRE-family HTH domain